MYEAYFRLYFNRMMARVLGNLERAAADERIAQALAGFPFLDAYKALLTREGPAGWTFAECETWWTEQIALWEAQTQDPLPLRALTRALGLSLTEINVLLAAGIVEDDVRFAALFAALQDPLPARRPVVGMLSWLLGELTGEAVDVWLAARRLIEHGLLVVGNQRDPRAEWQLQVPPTIWDGLRGRPSAHPAPGITWLGASEALTIDELILPDAIRSQVERVPELMHQGQIGALVLRGLSGGGRRTLIRAVARALGRDVLVCEADVLSSDAGKLLGPLATLMNAIPIIRCDPGPGDTIDLTRLPGYYGPVGVTLGLSGGLRGALVEQALSLTLPPPDPAARHEFWRSTGIPTENGSHDRIAGRFLLTGGLIHRAAALGATYAGLEDRPGINLGDVQVALRAINRQRLDTLATPLDPVDGWDNLIVDDSVMRELLTLEVRCRHREQLQQHAGPAFARTLNRGVRALFSGTSGVGKTLAARVLAAVLQKDLYRVDLASVVNKYIGETERNLNQVFAHAEALDVILLLDEGDALMARRTEVSTANDRYANLETNYLLQRLESYQGIVIITTNASQNIDRAFMRRLDVVVDFKLPEAAERLRLWDIHLPHSHAVSPDFLDTVAHRCTLTGGQIRNAALFATLLAMDEQQAVDDRLLEIALEREYRKAGMSYTLRGAAAPSNQLARLRRVLPRTE